MKLLKKLTFICLALSLMMVTACSTATKKDDSGIVTITFASGKDTSGDVKKLVEEFEKKNPKIKVKFKDMTSDSGKNHDQLVTMFSSKSSEIDAVALDVIWPAEFGQAGYLQPLDRYIQKDQLKMENYIKGAVQAGNVNGQQFAIPRFVDAGLLFYRKDLVSKPPETWDDLIATAKSTNKKGSTKYGYLMQAKQYEGLVCNFIEFIGAYGGRILDEKENIVINSPETIKGLKKMIEVTKSDFVPQNISTFTEIESHTAFLEGQAPFIRNWPYQYALSNDPKQSKIVNKVGVASLPKGDHDSASALGGWMTGISKNSKHKKEAWEFIKFITGSEGQKIAALKSLAPTYLPVYDDPEVQKAIPLFANKGFVEGVSKSIPRPVTPDYAVVSDAIQVEVSKAITGSQSAEDTVKNIEEKLKKIIKK